MSIARLRPGTIGTLRPVVAALCAIALLLGGCARARRMAEALNNDPAPAVYPTEGRIDVVLGQTLVVPVALDGAVNPAREIRVRLDDGRKVGAKLYWISVRPDPVEPTWGWLAPVGRWEATPAQSATRPSSAGSWALVMELPLNSVGQGLWIGGQRLGLNWLPDPAMVRAEANEGPWRRPLAGALGPRLLEFVGPEARSPVRRWRHRLLLDGLSPEDGAGAPRSRFDDPVIEALARQTEARWRVALAMLWGADAEVCERVKGRLAGAVDFGGAQFAPAWPTDQADLGTLLADLLAPKLEAPRRAERAVAWLETLPPAMAWVSDDAGLRDALGGRAVSTFGIANLTERATLAWATVGREPGTPDLMTLPARDARQITVVAPPPADRTPGPAFSQVTLHAGRWSTSRAAATEPLRATPPGVRIPALVGDWTMNALVSGGSDEAMIGESAWAAAGLLHRASDGSDRWSLYLECAGAPEGGDPETVRVWLGAFGSPSAVLKVSSDGSAMDEGAGAIPPGVDRPRVSPQPGKWVARIPIPVRCIEPGGTLRIAVERTDGRGRRSAWPRPMLPWQTEPGRVAVDLAAWGGLGAITPASATR